MAAFPRLAFWLVSLLPTIAPMMIARAQDSAATAAKTIDAADLARHIGALTHDSVSPRITPSPGLDRAAQYLAAQFEALGLHPGGDQGGWIQRYRVPGALDFAGSQLRFSAGNATATAGFASAVVLAEHAVPNGPLPQEVVVVSGHQTPKGLQDRIRDKTVVYIAPASEDTTQRLAVIRHLMNNNNWVVILSDEEAAGFAHRRRQAHHNPMVYFRERGGFYVHPDAAENLDGFLAAAGIDLAHVRTDSTPTVRRVPGTSVALEPKFTRPPAEEPAPNTIGIIPGTDSLLKNDYVIITAPLDERPPRDDLDRGGDDHITGVAGLLALAEAWMQPGGRPRRSVALIATSGGAPEFWGSRAVVKRIPAAIEFFQIFGTSTFGMNVVQLSNDLLASSGGSGFVLSASQGGDTAVKDSSQAQPAGGKRPPGIRTVVANITLDITGQMRGDSVIISGINDLMLKTPPSWIAAAHPALGLTVVDGGTAVAPIADHFPFARDGIPSLLLQTRRHDDTDNLVMEASSKLDAGQAVRILQLAFYLSRTIANADRPTEWSPEGRRRFVEALEQD